MKTVSYLYCPACGFEETVPADWLQKKDVQLAICSKCLHEYYVVIDEEGNVEVFEQ